ncbi:MAG: hypothetical protein KC609_12675 [Myxococcales bacterium]|nr:hypothetical protein [Myxococcales bacterium]
MSERIDRNMVIDCLFVALVLCSAQLVGACRCARVYNGGLGFVPLFARRSGPRVSVSVRRDWIEQDRWLVEFEVKLSGGLGRRGPLRVELLRARLKVEHRAGTAYGALERKTRLDDGYRLTLFYTPLRSWLACPILPKATLELRLLVDGVASRELRFPLPEHF